jgi:hypothetical protein
LWDNIFEKEADRQSLQEKTDVLSKQKLDLQKKVSKFNKKFEKNQTGKNLNSAANRN